MTCNYNDGGFLEGKDSQLIKINNCSFNKLECKNCNGGGFYLKYKNALIIENCLFNDIISKKKGGLFFFNNENSIKIIGTKIMNSKSLGFNGGVFFIEKTNNITVLNSKFINCSANSYGGVFAISDSNTFSFENFTVFNTTSMNSDGSFLDGKSFSNLKFKNCSFFLLKCEKNGGFYLKYDNILIIEKCLFNEVITKLKGGLMYFQNRNSIKMSSTKINTSKSFESNGGVFNFENNNNVSVMDSNFINCSSKTIGGIFSIAIFNIFKFENFTIYKASSILDGGFLYGKNSNTLSFKNGLFFFLKSKDSQGGGYFLHHISYILSP